MNTDRFLAALRTAFRPLDIDRLGSLLAVAAMWLLLLAATSGFATAADQLDVNMRTFRVVNLAGKTSLQPTEHARPGDVLEYQVSYRNTGATSARQVAATLPVPPGAMVYLPGSASPQRVEASLDGKTFAPAPLSREVVREGRKITEPVPPAEYRFLRWNLGDLPAGQSQSVSARMRVIAEE